MQNEKPNIAGQYQTLLVMWAALLISQFLFLILLFVVKPELYNFDFAQPIGGKEPMITLALAVAAVSGFVASFVLRKKRVTQAIEQQNPALVQAGLIMGVAFCEASTLLGVFLAFSFDYAYFFLFIALGILGILLHFPKRDDLMAASFKR
jgi:divalent metal cation (Fe/Co/Zn/Cd) transporter